MSLSCLWLCGSKFETSPNWELLVVSLWYSEPFRVKRDSLGCLSRVPRPRRTRLFNGIFFCGDVMWFVSPTPTLKAVRVIHHYEGTSGRQHPMANSHAPDWLLIGRKGPLQYFHKTDSRNLVISLLKIAPYLVEIFFITAEMIYLTAPQLGFTIC